MTAEDTREDLFCSVPPLYFVEMSCMGTVKTVQSARTL